MADRTILDVHRELFAKLDGCVSPSVLGLLRIAFEMGKKMDNKVRQYKGGHGDDWWAKNRLAGGELEGRDARPAVGFALPPMEKLKKVGRLPAWW